MSFIHGTKKISPIGPNSFHFIFPKKWIKDAGFPTHVIVESDDNENLILKPIRKTNK